MACFYRQRLYLHGYNKRFTKDATNEIRGFSSFRDFCDGKKAISFCLAFCVAPSKKELTLKIRLRFWESIQLFIMDKSNGLLKFSVDYPCGSE